MKKALNLPRAASELPLPNAAKAGEANQIADSPLVEGGIELTGRALDQAVRDEFDRLLNLRSTHEGHRG